MALHFLMQDSPLMKRRVILALSVASVFSLVCVSNVFNDSLFGTWNPVDSELETQPMIFKPTKFGPLRRNENSPSRYTVLALWESAENSLETCMDATNTIFPHLQDTNCLDIERGFQLLSR
jgi:hypothetical protein